MHIAAAVLAAALLRERGVHWKADMGIKFVKLWNESRADSGEVVNAGVGVLLLLSSFSTLGGSSSDDSMTIWV